MSLPWQVKTLGIVPLFSKTGEVSDRAMMYSSMLSPDDPLVRAGVYQTETPYSYKSASVHS